MGFSLCSRKKIPERRRIRYFEVQPGSVEGGVGKRVEVGKKSGEVSSLRSRRKKNYIQEKPHVVAGEVEGFEGYGC